MRDSETGGIHLIPALNGLKWRGNRKATRGSGFSRIHFMNF